MLTCNHKLPISDQVNKYAIVAITRHGVALAQSISEKIFAEMNQLDIYFPEKFQGEFQSKIFNNDVIKQHFYPEKTKDLLKRIFFDYKGIISIISLGALVRLLAPLLHDKKIDPAVVVIDENSQFVISVLSGHVGGGNDLARTIAEKIGATPVITTASDVQKTLAVDLLGKEFGWIMESCEYLTEISAAVVNDEPVAIVQESGERDWWKYDTPLPANIIVYENIQDALLSHAEYFIMITHREYKVELELLEKKNKKTVVFRPRVIGIGLGCNRNTSEQEIQNVVFETLDFLGYSLHSVRNLASIDLKKDEPGLVSFCIKMKWQPIFYSTAELNTINVENRSERVYKHTGAYAVSEPAAKLLTGNSKLEMLKKVSGNVTISVGLEPRLFSEIV